MKTGVFVICVPNFLNAVPSTPRKAAPLLYFASAITAVGSEKAIKFYLSKTDYFAVSFT